MCFFVAQFIKASQTRMRYWNSVLNEAAPHKDYFVASGFEHPSLLIVRQEEQHPFTDLASWGLIPGWCKTEKEAVTLSNSTLNAKGETLFEKPSFIEAVSHSRCTIPVNGFYEFRHSGSAKVPYFISLKNEPLFSLAGLFSEWRSRESGSTIKTFSIVTTTANPLMEQIHNTKKRMPLILSPQAEAEWLSSSTSPESVKELITSYPDQEMQAWRVAPFLSKGRAQNSPGAMVSIEPQMLF